MSCRRPLREVVHSRSTATSTPSPQVLRAHTSRGYNSAARAREWWRRTHSIVQTCARNSLKTIGLLGRWYLLRTLLGERGKYHCLTTNSLLLDIAIHFDRIHELFLPVTKYPRECGSHGGHPAGYVRSTVEGRPSAKLKNRTCQDFYVFVRIKSRNANQISHIFCTFLHNVL